MCKEQEVEPFYYGYLLKYSSLLPIEKQKTLLTQETGAVYSG